MKLSNAEKEAIEVLTRAEGWLALKKVAHLIVATNQQELFGADANDSDRMLALAHKNKWTSVALTTFINTLESIKETLDKAD